MISLLRDSLLPHILLLFRTFSSALSSSFPYSLVVQVLFFGIIHFFPMFSHFLSIFSCCSGSSLWHYPLFSHILLLFRNFSSALATSFPYSLVQVRLCVITHIFSIFPCCSGPSLWHYPLLSHVLLLFRIFSSALSSSFPYSLVQTIFRHNPVLSHILLLFRTFSSALDTSFPYSLVVQDLLFGIIYFFPIFSCCSGSYLRHYPLLSLVLLLFKTFSSALSTSFPCSLVVQNLLFGIILFFSIFSNCSGSSLPHYPILSHILLLFRSVCASLSTPFPDSLVVQCTLYNVHPLHPAVTKKSIVYTGDLVY
jgi:hypothetical protein